MRRISLTHTELAKLSTDVLRRCGQFRFEARGSSMSPFIHDGDVLTVQPVQAETLRPGDIAFYHTGGDRLAAHRVIRRELQGKRVRLTMRADALAAANELVAEEQVLGRVVCVQRGAQVIHLDRNIQRVTALLWIMLSPLGFVGWMQMVKRAALWLLRRLHGVKPYRVVVRKLINKHIRYRMATVEDASALARLHGYDRLPELENPVGSLAGSIESLQGRGYMLIASLGNRIAGAVIVRRFSGNASLYPDWWLFGMFVRTRYRGVGIGEGLARRALEQASAEGAARINLLVFEQNGAAVNLYRKLGFRASSMPGLDKELAAEVRPGEWGHIIMSKPLGANH